MSDKLLVAYATRYGSTREVAEEIAATPREAGSVADVQSAEHARTLAGYRAVMVGAPLYMFNWLKPFAVELFGGKFDPARLTFPYNLIPALRRRVVPGEMAGIT